MKKNILLVYGEGGHHEQAKRLMNKMMLADNNLNFIHIVDSEKLKNDNTPYFYSVKPIRHKNVTFSPWTGLQSYLRILGLTLKVLKEHKPRAVVGFGPGICIPVFMVCTVMNVKKRIFIEDWCRFSTKSLSGRLCAPFSTKFFIQNESLKELYPNAKFSGRL